MGRISGPEGIFNLPLGNATQFQLSLCFQKLKEIIAPLKLYVSICSLCGAWPALRAHGCTFLEVSPSNNATLISE